MMWVLHKFRLFDLATLDWDQDFDVIGIDSLETIAVVTSIEHQFHMVFEDKLFDSFRTLNQIHEALSKNKGFH